MRAKTREVLVEDVVRFVMVEVISVVKFLIYLGLSTLFFCS